MKLLLQFFLINHGFNIIHINLINIANSFILRIYDLLNEFLLPDITYITYIMN